jgi:hypothetical protein
LAAFGGFTVSNSFGLWNSASWNSFVLENYQSNRLYPVVCANMSSSVAVAYSALADDDMYLAELAIISSNDFSAQRFTAPTPFYLSALGISVIEERIFLYSIAETAGVIQIFHTKNHTWQNIEFPINGESTLCCFYV